MTRMLGHSWAPEACLPAGTWVPVTDRLVRYLAHWSIKPAAPVPAPCCGAMERQKPVRPQPGVTVWEKDSSARAVTQEVTERDLRSEVPGTALGLLWEVALASGTLSLCAFGCSSPAWRLSAPVCDTPGAIWPQEPGDSAWEMCVGSGL